MKLLNKSTLYLIFFLIPVFVISGFILYAIISKQINDNTDEALLAQKLIIIENFIETDSTEQHFFNDSDDDVSIKLLSKSHIAENIFSDIVAYDSSESEYVPFRQLKSYFTNRKNTFKILITRSNFKSDDLVESISIALAIMFGLILISVVFINRLISRNLLSPFYETLEKLNQLSFADITPHSFSGTSTKEFRELNDVINRMTNKMFADYNNQKQFTENASHELQTPLAVIKARMDVLIQDKTLSEESIEQIQEIDKAVNKLSHLNKSLLLLSKIENRQFEEAVLIDLQKLTDKIIAAFDDSIKNKKILLHKEYRSLPVLKMNLSLAEILFSNMMQNAIRHNFTDGIIEIEITENYFEISNSGEPIMGNEEKLFNRFTKFNPSVESIGLGLSIVKQICEYYNFSIQYNNKEELHYFKINFDN